jgi:hypothetical protein
MIGIDERNQTVGSEAWVLPWEIRPYQLISWWRMEKFSAEVLLHIARFCELSRNEIKGEMRQPGKSRATLFAKNPRSESLRPETLEAIKNHCKTIGLSISMKSVDSILTMYEPDLPASLGDVLDSIETMEKTIVWEMEDRLFMFIPADRAAHYGQKELFGKGVNAKFPDIQFDMVEAGNCYAAGRGTAVVFHLMRIMETGVQQFGTKLGVPLTGEKVWQVILDGVNAKIKSLPPKDPSTISMSQTAANLYAVKLAWRNEVMHPKDTYTLEEADNLIRQVKIFMEQLATIV